MRLKTLLMAALVIALTPIGFALMPVIAVLAIIGAFVVELQGLRSA